MNEQTHGSRIYGAIYFDDANTITGISIYEAGDYWSACGKALRATRDDIDFQIIDPETMISMSCAMWGNGPHEGTATERLDNVRRVFSQQLAARAIDANAAGPRAALRFMEAVGQEVTYNA
jgi:hypothetical protein